MRKNYLWLGILCLGLLGVGWWFTRPEMAVVRVAVPTSPVFGVVFVSEAEEFFEKRGVRVELREFGSGKDALADMVAGNSDLALAYETPVVSTIYGGEDLSILTSLHSSNKSTVLLARNDRGIGMVEDLKGKTVGVVRGTNADYFLHLLLSEHGVDDEELKIVDLEVGTIVDAVKNGNVDAIAMWTAPLVLLDQELRDVVNVFDSNVYFEQSLLVGKRGWVESHQDAVLLLMRGLADGENFMDRNRETGIQIVAEQTGMSVVEVAAVNENNELRLGLDTVMLTIMQSEGEWFKRNNMFTGDVPDYEKYVDEEYLEAIKPDAVTL